MSSFLKIFIIFTTIAILLIQVNAETQADKDRMTNFPWVDGQLQAFELYSGLLDVRGGKGKIHYVFMTSQQNKTTDPVVVWLNGGPGCSSLLGMISENGPYLIPNLKGNFSQELNPYSWNRVAHMLYLQSPVGVGFSSSTDPTYVYNDTNSAKDNFEAIVAWL